MKLLMICLMVFGSVTFPNIRHILANEKQFSASDAYARELSEKLIERKVIMKTFHTFLRYHFPEYEPRMPPYHLNDYL